MGAFANIKAALSRIEEFLDEPELVKYVRALHGDHEDIRIQNASLSWDSSPTGDNATELGITLKKVNLSVKQGTTVVLAGQVGAGKSSVFGALTNQMNLIEGSVELNSNVTIAPQEPWLMSGTVRENIIFGALFDQKWYQKVVSSCGLLPDFKEFDMGDETSVGQEGIALSGGQRARIGLARAIYQKPQVILLDDPLSAVDRHVSKKIWNECILDILRWVLFEIHSRFGSCVFS